MGARLNQWPSVRAAYVEGWIPNPDQQPFTRAWPTLEEVAVTHGMKITTVANRATQEGWGNQREQFQLEVDQARRRWLVEQRTDRVTRVDDRGLSAAEAGLALVGMRLTHLLRAQEPMAESQRGQQVDARELSALGLAGKRFLDMKAQVMGEPLTAAEGTLDDMEREARLEDRRIAEQLVAFIAERQAEQVADESVSV